MVVDVFLPEFIHFSKLCWSRKVSYLQTIGGSISFLCWCLGLFGLFIDVTFITTLISTVPFKKQKIIGKHSFIFWYARGYIGTKQKYAKWQFNCFKTIQLFQDIFDDWWVVNTRNHHYWSIYVTATAVVTMVWWLAEAVVFFADIPKFIDHP